MSSPRDAGWAHVPDPDYSWGDITQADVCWGDDNFQPHVIDTTPGCPVCANRGGPT
jgi:hypothetical protein